jgi:spore coat polysaccharide biosynthesis predicted glycosyltransferase SpsG
MKFTPDSVDVYELPSAESDDRSWVSKLGPDVVITDSHNFSLNYYRAIRDNVDTLTAIIDDARTSVSADVVVNDNIYANELEYDWGDRPPKTCFGPDYLHLRKSFRMLANHKAPWRDPPRRALIVMGGVDKENRTPLALQAISHFDVDATVVIGPGFDNETAIRAAAGSISNDVTIRIDPENLPSLMFQSDFAVATLGTIVHELLCTQTPIVGIPDNDTPIATVLADRDLAIVLDREPNRSELSAAIRDLINDPDRRRAMRERADVLISGNGPENVVNAILEVHG